MRLGCHVEAPEMVMLLPAAIGWSELPLHYDVSQCCAHHACNCLISFDALTQNTNHYITGKRLQNLPTLQSRSVIYNSFALAGMM